MNSTETDLWAQHRALSLLAGAEIDLSDSANQLATALGSRDRRIAEWSARKLGKIGAPAQCFAPDIRAAIRAGRIASSAGISALLGLKQPVWSSLPGLNEELSQTNMIPAAAVDCAVRLGDKRIYVLPGLSNVLHHPDARFVAEVIRSLESMG